jgi:hypothetical protein
MPLAACLVARLGRWQAIWRVTACSGRSAVASPVTNGTNISSGNKTCQTQQPTTPNAGPPIQTTEVRGNNRLNLDGASRAIYHALRRAMRIICGYQTQPVMRQIKNSIEFQSIARQ